MRINNIISYSEKQELKEYLKMDFKKILKCILCIEIWNKL